MGLTGQELQRLTTQLSTQNSTLACTAPNEWADLATEQEIATALSDIQWSKGKFYSQVIERMTEKMPKGEFEKRTMEHRTGMIAAIKRLKVNREELEVITRRAKQAEFTGSAFMPLPTEADLFRITKEVQGDMLHKKLGENSHQPPPIDMAEHEGKTMDELWEILFEKAGLTKMEQTT